MLNKNSYPVIKLQKGKDEAVKRFHPWIFSGAIQQIPKQLSAGEIVFVLDHQEQLLGTAFYEGGNIALKMLSFSKEVIDYNFWLRKISVALKLREQLGLLNNASTTAWRLVHSEGDGLPGLIVDIYGTTAVFQAQSAGMYLHRNAIASAIVELMQGQIKAVYDKSAEALERMDKTAGLNEYIIGEAGDNIVLENGLSFFVDWERGQKTGFFLDQRDARSMLKKYSAGRKVLNTFSYSGGFSVAALKGDAEFVVSVDSSKKAIELCDRNIQLNEFESRHQSVCAETKKYLEIMNPADFDVIVLDPPAFAKNHHNRHKGLQGYKYINFEAIRKIAPGGLLFTFSCSQAVDRQSFQSIVMAAAIETGRSVQLLHHLSQPPDHPVSIYHPEGAYLKGLVLRVG
ncbi:MAG: class I SAM-dependent rRNA methyltransferase [Bacteroidetes bacterium]|jgi:23S rRNA (cytosine1962-C5)-methyltransferase|nr:class I SAM-dependent rRNA methyltransferase [Bacteroidota bacterium]